MAHLSNYYFRRFSCFCIAYIWNGLALKSEKDQKPRGQSEDSPSEGDGDFKTPSLGVPKREKVKGGLCRSPPLAVSMGDIRHNVSATANGAKSNAFCVKLIIRLTWPRKGDRSIPEIYAEICSRSLQIAPGPLKKTPSGYWPYIKIPLCWLRKGYIGSVLLKDKRW